MMLVTKPVVWLFASSELESHKNNKTISAGVRKMNIMRVIFVKLKY